MQKESNEYPKLFNPINVINIKQFKYLLFIIQ